MSTMTTVPAHVEVAPEYAAILSQLRSADRLAIRAAARIACVYQDHARNETLALCERIIAGCEARRMVRETRLGINEDLYLTSIL